MIRIVLNKDQKKDCNGKKRGTGLGQCFHADIKQGALHFIVDKPEKAYFNTTELSAKIKYPV